MNHQQSQQLFSEALQYFPGGVSSPVRAFRSVGGTPIFMESGKGCHITDVDGNTYIDFCCSWGPLILGHAPDVVLQKLYEAMQKGTSFGTPSAYELALGKLIVDNNRFIEKIRFVSSGTEAVMSAIRLARGYTQRDKILKFEGCYHGHADSLLVKAGSGLVTFGISSSAGVPQSVADSTIVVALNDEAAVRQAFAENPDIAAIIIEPIPANNGLLVQNRDYLAFLRQICNENGALLIFDEVISGFRVGFEGAAGYYDIAPDLVTYGKIIGGGLPVGAYGGSKTLMSYIAPDGPVYQAGTLSGNPMAMAAGIAQLSTCLSKGFYEQLEQKTAQWIANLNQHCESHGYPCYFMHIGSIFWIVFSQDHTAIRAAEQIDANSMQYFRTFYHALLERGVYLGPSGYEVGFVSAAHTTNDLVQAQQAIETALSVVFS